MGILKNNPLLMGLRGKVGNVVFRQCGDKVIVTRLPAKRKTTTTTRQRDWTNKFRDAVRYASMQMEDPESKAEYAARAARKKLSAHTVAMRDYLRAPVITDIDTSAYRGRPGDIIAIAAHDDFNVTSVRVAITDCDGNVIERGSARLHEGSVDVWHYKAKCENKPLSCATIIAVAQDKPGNATIETKVLQVAPPQRAD